MRLGFVTAILPELELEEVVRFAADEGFACLEVMCWPAASGDARRYAGTTHIDAAGLTDVETERVRALLERHGIEISALGYYPNPLAPDAEERRAYAEHLRAVISAAARLGVGVVNSFVGRDPARPIEAQWELVEAVWGPLVAHAEAEGVRIGIENCPMLFSLDEWPGGKNLAVSPAVWRELFERIPSPHFGLNFDPSHLHWLGIDHLRALREFRDRVHHVHVKDERIDRELLQERGILGLGWHVPKIPGLGDIDWDAYFRVLGEIGWAGPAVIEVEDRAFEDTLEDRKEALRQSKRYLDAVLERGYAQRRGGRPSRAR